MLRLLKMGIILSVLLLAAFTLGCTEVATNPNDAATQQALYASENKALDYVKGHQFYNSIVVETPAYISSDSRIVKTMKDSGDGYQYTANVYIKLNESRFNQTTSTYSVVPHRVYVQVAYYTTGSAYIRAAAMDGEYDLLNFRPLLGNSGWK